MKNRAAFTMVELVFVIVIMGILAAVAIPKLAASRTDAEIAKGRANIAAVRSGVVTERQERLFRGDSTYAATLDGLGATSSANDLLFTTVLQQGIPHKATSNGWRKTALREYQYRISTTDIEFEYDNTNGTFDCNRSLPNASGRYCKDLTE